MVYSLLRTYYATSVFSVLRHKGTLVALLFLLMVYPYRLVAQIDAEMVTNMGRNALSVDDYLTAIHYFNQAIESKPFLSSPYYYSLRLRTTAELKPIVQRALTLILLLPRCINYAVCAAYTWITLKGPWPIIRV